MPTDGVIRILTVDDHALLRRGIAALVNAEPDMKLAAEATMPTRKRLRSSGSIRPDVTLLHVTFARKITRGPVGTASHRRRAAAQPAIPVRMPRKPVSRGVRSRDPPSRCKMRTRPQK